MKIIKALAQEKYTDRQRYNFVDGIIFEDKVNETYCITLCCELEAGEEEDMQYPLEDILDKYYVNCTDYLETQIIEDKIIFIFELEGSLDKEDNYNNISDVAALIGKRVFNYEDDGCIKLGISE